MRFEAGNFDIAVVGAGHAGCEAALAAAKLGLKTVVFAVTLEGVANMACNPSIGGTAKGQLVREIDALGGAMGYIADKTAIQFKILNSAKGPAVYSPRAQIDRKMYHIEMKHELELCENLELKQAEIVEILTEKDENGKQYVTGVVTHLGAIYRCKCAVLCTGTYLKGRIIIGDVSYSGGPDGQFPANKLTDSLVSLGFDILRLKTGTPARVNKRNINFEVMDPQYGDEKIVPFSFLTEKPEYEQTLCYLTHTTPETKKIIMDNLERSPIYNGDISGVGPRYCPSIETKIMKFADKDVHQVFIEPCGAHTEEMYLQGLSSSLPEDVQLEFIHTVTGLENVEVMRPAYAIEYDAIDATALKLSLEARSVDGLFFAGQINGSSGYEEAAAQGIVAGINAAQKIKGKEPLIIDRSEGYIGVLIDDLVTRGTKEPYRMMTSRAEYRLLLRQDNADLRLSEKAYEVGMIDKARYDHVKEKERLIEAEEERLKVTSASPKESVNEYLESKNSTPLKTGCMLCELLRRPELCYDDITEIEKRSREGRKEDSKETSQSPELSDEIKEQVEISVKYEGYIRQQRQTVAQFKKLERKKLPPDLNYSEIGNISKEGREKLDKIKPESLGQASRITGVSPADIGVLAIYLKAKGLDR